MTNQNPNVKSKPLMSHLLVWIPYVGMTAIALVFIAMFISVGNEEVNSRFLFNNPLRELVVTSGLAFFGLWGCLAAWQKRTAFTKGNEKSSELVFCVLMVIFILTQIPFLQVQKKMEVLAGEMSGMSSAMSAVVEAANDPANGITPEMKNLLTKEIFREAMVQAGDLQIHKQIK